MHQLDTVMSAFCKISWQKLGAILKHEAINTGSAGHQQLLYS